MNLIEAVAVLVLQRVPFVNRIPFVANAGTIDAALTALTKAAQRLENVHTHQRSAAEEQRKIAAIATAAADEYEAVAARAKRIAGRVSDFLA
jgi:GTP1/Obg family GTP-binding protein